MGINARTMIALGIGGILISFLWPLIVEKSLLSCPWYSFSSSQSTVTLDDRLTGERQFTLEELSRYDGSDPELPIYLSIAGHVLDVSSAAKFYGKGQTYNLFAGKAATRALALASLENEDINDDVSDFNEKQKADLEERINFYLSKYPKVGVLASYPRL